MPSVSRRNPISFASAADFDTVAVLTVSNALMTAGIGPWGIFLSARRPPAARRRRPSRALSHVRRFKLQA
jgi:hypothetical protein